MIEVIQGRRLAEMSRQVAAEQREAGNVAAADMIECLADEIDRLLPVPPVRSWEGVWGEFDKRSDGARTVSEKHL